MVTMLRTIAQGYLPGGNASAIAQPKQRPVFLDILSISAFRYLWLGNGLSFMGMRVRDMAVAWLVLEMTNSKLWVGLVNGLPTVSIILFSLIGGVLADRTDRRVLMLWSRLTLASLTFLSAFLIATGTLQLWHLIIIVVLAVGVNTQEMSTSRTVMLDIVGKGRLLGATSLNSMAMDIGAIAGPAIAGVLIADVGVDAALFMLGGVYLLAFASLLFIRGSSEEQDSVGNQHKWDRLGPERLLL